MMDERIKESISSLLDDEADELALRRVLSHAEQHEVRALWGRYSQVSNMMSSGRQLLPDNTSEVEGQTGVLSIDVSKQVAQAIEEETFDIRLEDHDRLGSSHEVDDIVNPSGSWVDKFKAGLPSRVAVAAAVILAVSFSINDFSSEQDPWVVTTQPIDEPASLEVSNQLQVAEKTFTPEHARRLNEYLLRHAENSLSGGRSGVMPLARVASFTITEN